MHSLIIPRLDVPTVNDLTEAQIGLPGAMVLRAKALIAEKGIADSSYRRVLG